MHHSLKCSCFVASSVRCEHVTDLDRFRRPQVSGLARGRLPLLPSRQQQHVPYTRIRTLAGGTAVSSSSTKHVPATRIDGT